MIDDDVVTVTGRLGVRDWSGNWDDDYEGSIQYLLLVEPAPPAAPSNVSITGVEALEHGDSLGDRLLEVMNVRADFGASAVAIGEDELTGANLHKSSLSRVDCRQGAYQPC